MASEPIQVQHDHEGDWVRVYDPDQGETVPYVNPWPCPTSAKTLEHLGLHPDQAIRVTRGDDEGSFISVRNLARQVWVDALWQAMQLSHGEILERAMRGEDLD